MTKSEVDAGSAARSALTIDQFGQRYNVSRSTIYQELKSGRLHARKCGDRTLISNEDAERWLRGAACLRQQTPRQGRKTMSAKTEKQFYEAAADRIAAGDRVFHVLATLPARTAIAVATLVEYLLTLKWQREQKRLLDAGDKSWVFGVSNKDVADARTAFTSVCPSESDPRAEQRVMGLLSAFDLDEQWWTMHRVREEIVGWFRMKGAA